MKTPLAIPSTALRNRSAGITLGVDSGSSRWVRWLGLISPMQPGSLQSEQLTSAWEQLLVVFLASLRAIYGDG